MGGVDAELVRAAGEGSEADLKFAVRQGFEYFVFCNCLLSVFIVNYLPRAVVVVGGEGEGNSPTRAGAEIPGGCDTRIAGWNSDRAAT